ncbi:hypothetical protein [Hymenobacter sp. BRD67]|uniref:hypothetical protein n=1 Tax=Hymenobacter sp. BRD67 TaxID=2675877 RepID=UPI001565AA94|nr:hypothetical protein [Hymenobacter sp. BRD67]QKG51838.1 hypothetical protein GKZ67_03485 [Hymenobacter sp. BRD67]
MDVSGIVKGLIYPLRNAAVTLLWLIGELFAAATYLFFAARKANDVGRKDSEIIDPIKYQIAKINTLTVMWFIALIVSAFLMIMYCTSIESDHMHYAVFWGSIALPTASVAVVLAYSVIDNKIMLNDFEKGDKKVFETKNLFYKSIDYFVLAVSSYFLLAAFSYGAIDSRKIEKHISYDYIKDNSFLEKEGICPDNILIYLGAVNDKYFFIDYNTSYYLAVDKGTVPVLLLAHHEDYGADLGLSDYFSSFSFLQLVCIILLTLAILLFLFKMPWNKFGNYIKGLSLRKKHSPCDVKK